MIPMKIRYYNCRNNGTDISIWPQLRAASNHDRIIWDGRSLSGYRVDLGSSVTVDLAFIGISRGQEFVLAENTLFGTDMWDSNFVFCYDPDSNLTAYATRTGRFHNGSLMFSEVLYPRIDDGEYMPS
ncbi:hypothetical protein F4801DRAFT_556792 [Xylaria longipes]|nr:hypothetical protein F4801DRAFT_556792 [Xylaria longipes]